jgi:uncharacterized membrane protein YccC
MSSSWGPTLQGSRREKALFRVWGTVVGIVVGLLLVDAVGHNTDWTLAVVLVSMFFGFYLMRVNSIFFVIAIIVSISQLYQELHTFSNTLLLYRLYETALGCRSGHPRGDVRASSSDPKGPEGCPS